MTSSLESVIILPGRDEAKQATFLDDGRKNSGGGGASKFDLLLLPNKESLFPFLYT